MDKKTDTPFEGEDVKVDRLLLTSEEFVEGFVPPDPLIEGVISKSFFYSLTAPTGWGKTSIALLIALLVDRGSPLGEREVEQGNVLFMAGENSTDIRMRWIALCENHELEPEKSRVKFLDGVHRLSDEALRRRIASEIDGRLDLIVVDTSVAYFEGDEENDNTQMVAHARMLRSLIDDIPGRPTVVVTCHPTKNPDRDNLVPRGGGAFLAEVDGNLVAIKNGSTVELTWHGKFRGVDFAPVPFQLVSMKSEKLKDRKGRHIWTVVARQITRKQHAEMEVVSRRREDALLSMMNNYPDSTMEEWADLLDWRYASGQPDKTSVKRAIDKLKADNLVKKDGRHWVLTLNGKKQAKQQPKQMHEEMLI